MRPAPYRVAQLTDAHDRSAFTSGSELLDRYFHTQVTQDIRRRVTACYVALTEEQRVAGYYTLAAASVLLSALSPEIQKKLPRYPSVPTVLMGRLAVDRAFRGQGLGGALLADGLHRSAHGRCQSPGAHQLDEFAPRHPLLFLPVIVCPILLHELFS